MDERNELDQTGNESPLNQPELNAEILPADEAMTADWSITIEKV